MKLLCLVWAVLGSFEVQELPVANNPSSFVEHELVIKAVDNRPTFELLSASWCGGCQSVKQSLSKLDRDQLPFKYRVRNVDTEGWLDAGSIPAFAINGRVFQYGYSNPESLLKNYQASLTSAPTRQRSVSQRLSASELKEFASSYQGPTVKIKGMTAYGHLQDGNHGFSASQLQGLTESECFKIHGAHHYNYLTPYKVGN